MGQSDYKNSEKEKYQYLEWGVGFFCVSNHLYYLLNQRIQFVRILIFLTWINDKAHSLESFDFLFIISYVFIKKNIIYRQFINIICKQIWFFVVFNNYIYYFWVKLYCLFIVIEEAIHIEDLENLFFELYGKLSRLCL